MAGVDQDGVLQHTHMLAMGVLIETLLEGHLRASGDADKASRTLLDRFERVSERMTFDGVHPTLSDHAAQEYRDTLIRHVLRARALATGEPLDPNAYRKDWRIDPA